MPEVERDLPETHLIREGSDLVHIYKPEGTYSIYYMVHEPSAGPRSFLDNLVTTLDPAKLPEDTSGLFLEGTFNYIANPLGHLTGQVSSKTHQGMFASLHERGIPSYFAEVAFTNTVTWPPLTVWAEASMVVGETMMGMGLIDKSTNRRGFLKALQLGAAAYLLLPFLSSAGRLLIDTEQSIEFRKLSRKIHPNVAWMSLTLREVVLAHKQEWLARQDGNKPHFLTTMGKDHVGLEDQFQSTPDEKLALLERTRFIWRPLVEPETFYKAVKFIPSNGTWKIGEIFEVPELKELVT